MKTNQDIKKEADEDEEDEEPEGFSETEKPVPLKEYKITLPLVQRNGLHVLAARLNMSFSQVVTIALERMLRLDMSQGNYTMLSDSTLTDDLIGQAICRDMGVREYWSREKQIPNDRLWLFVQSKEEDEIEQ